MATNDNLTKLAELRAKGQISPDDVEMDDLAYLKECGVPFEFPDCVGKDGKQRAVVLTKVQLIELGGFTYTHPTLGEITILEENVAEGTPFVLFPDQLKQK